MCSKQEEKRLTVMKLGILLYGKIKEKIHLYAASNILLVIMKKKKKRGGSKKDRNEELSLR